MSQHAETDTLTGGRRSWLWPQTRPKVLAALREMGLLGPAE